MATPDSLKAFQIANSPDFQKRVLLIALKIAADVLAEANTVKAHNERAQYARRVFGADQRKEAQRAAFAIVAVNRDTVAAAKDHTGFTDAAIESAVSSVWNHLSGVFTPEDVAAE